MKHTPGPWREDCFNVGYSGKDGSFEHLTGCTYMDIKRKLGNEYTANIKLMAAAPELLEAAKAALSILDQSITHRLRRENSIFEADMKHFEKTLNYAIKKAEGES